MQPHTPTPWHHVTHHGQSFVTDAPLVEGQPFLGNVIVTESANKNALADAKRIVTCVNACAGIEDPAKALANVRSLLEAIIGEAEGLTAAFRSERLEITESAKAALRALGG